MTTKASAPRMAQPPVLPHRYRPLRPLHMRLVPSSCLCIAPAEARARRIPVKSGGEMRAFSDEFDRFAFRIDRTNVQGVIDKDARGGFPGMRHGKFGAASRRDLQRFQTRRTQIIVE